MRTAVALLLACAASCSLAQYAEVDRFVEASLRRYRVPGASLAIVRHGRVVHSRGYGHADLENGVRAKPETVYQIGSVTKQFTATAVMMLAEQGKLGLDDRILAHFPEFPAAWSEVRVGHLLNHTSGIPSYTGVPAFFSRAVQPARPGDLVELLKHLPLDFAPGSDWRYNNSGYFILGMLIEKAAGMPYAEALKEMIFQPLRMSSSGLNDPARIVKNRARGYALTEAGVQNAEYISMDWPYSAGAMISSALDLAKWEAAQGSEALLKKASWQMMWSPTRLLDGTERQYGYGWALGVVGEASIIEHGGAIPGFSAIVRRYPTRGLAVILLTNLVPAHEQEIAAGIGAILDPTLKEPEPKPIQDADSATTARLRSVFEDALEGRLKPEYFTRELAAFLFPDRAGEARELKRLAPLSRFFLTSQREESGLTLRDYAAKLGDSWVKVLFAVDKEGKIAAFGIRGG